MGGAIVIATLQHTDPGKRLTLVSGGKALGPLGDDPRARVRLQPASDLVMISDPAGPQAEAIRALRTHILTSHLQLGRRALVVCAPNPQAGCTFVAANLAVALSQIGARTLLIDGDLRDPSLQRFFPGQRPGAPGLYECLNGGAAVSKTIVTDAATGLSVMYAGEAASDAPELLSSERFRALMDFCLREYDVTIVDTPPASRCADARLISSVVGYSLIVARRDHSFVAEAKTLADELRQDHALVIGAVLNEA
ncbi:MAG: CpsD/CapB family tyrosine-protein kinase [Caulobacteraceae bacterium]|nr:CpsD/CapB family tyrosine-protein kinase [Caulobacteraceae bacterium]